jgi:hypothetical protein
MVVESDQPDEQQCWLALACCVVSVMDDCSGSDVVAETHWARLESTTSRGLGRSRDYGSRLFPRISGNQLVGAIDRLRLISRLLAEPRQH